jgi:hypothetical protein
MKKQFFHKSASSFLFFQSIILPYEDSHLGCDNEFCFLCWHTDPCFHVLFCFFPERTGYGFQGTQIPQRDSYDDASSRVPK